MKIYLLSLIVALSFSTTIPSSYNVTRFLDDIQAPAGYTDTSFLLLSRLDLSKYENILSSNDISLESNTMDAKSVHPRESIPQKFHSSEFISFGPESSHSSDNCYMIKFKHSANNTELEDISNLLREIAPESLRTFQISRRAAGLKICFPSGELPLGLLQMIEGIEHVERDLKVKADTIQNIQKEAPWGLAALSQSFTANGGGIKGSYVYDRTGKGVTVYLVDSGVAVGHPEFSGRASIGYEIFDNGSHGGDCAGHGTEVGSVVIGKHVGVAKEANLVAVSVLDCDGEGTNSDLVFAIEWILKNRQDPCVINMSVGGDRSRTVDAAVREAVAQGIPVVVAAGNSNVDACTQSPSCVESAIVVGATTKSNRKASFSNFGSCVHLFAPGENIVVANARATRGRTSDLGSASGTSLATPFVAGIAALLLEENPNMTPEQVKKRLQQLAMNGAIRGPIYGSPNLLAQAIKPSGDMAPQEPVQDEGMSTTAIVLMIVGIVAVLAILIGTIIYLKRRRRNN